MFQSVVSRGQSKSGVCGGDYNSPSTKHFQIPSDAFLLHSFLPADHSVQEDHQSVIKLPLFSCLKRLLGVQLRPVRPDYAELDAAAGQEEDGVQLSGLGVHLQHVQVELHPVPLLQPVSSGPQSQPGGEVAQTLSVPHLSS